MGYDADRRILAVTFRSGRVKHYAGVTEETYEQLSSADSLGKAFLKLITKQYETAVMTGECPNCGADHGWIGDTCTDCGTATYADQRPTRGVSA